MYIYIYMHVCTYVCIYVDVCNGFIWVTKGAKAGDTLSMHGSGIHMHVCS